MKAEGRKRDTILWHYCSVEAFINIIKTQKLRFSDVTKSNDRSEIEYIGDLYSEYKSADMQTYKGTSFLLRNDSKYGRGVYSFSLSQKKDDLNMWRGYAPYGGFSIGFSKKGLEDLASNSTIAIECNNVIYVSKRKIPSDLKRFFDEIYTKCLDNNKKDNIYLMYPAQFLDSKSLFYKHIGFESEKEWRMVFRNYLDIFRTDLFVNGIKCDLKCDFYEIPFDISIIKRVIIGPKTECFSNNLLEDVDNFIKSYMSSKSTKIMVKYTDLPFK